MTTRLTPERLAEIQTLTTRIDLFAPEYVTELLAELDAVTRERDMAYRRVVEFTGAPDADEAFQVIAEPVDWDAIATYHGIPDPDRCAACGGLFEPMQARHYFGPPEGWVVKQRLGPIHSQCQRRPAAYEDALAKVLAARSSDSAASNEARKPEGGFENMPEGGWPCDGGKQPCRCVV